MGVEVIDETGRCPHAPELEEALSRLLGELAGAGREATVVVVDDEKIAALNARDRGVHGPTDVLSYPMHEPTDVAHPTLPHLGDVYVSLETATSQAAGAGHAPVEEVAALAAHGLTHLLGHDHQSEHEWGPFRAAQARVVDILAEMTHRSEG